MTKKNGDMILATIYKQTKIEISSKDYARYLNDKNKSAIAEMIFCRLYGRYLKPHTFENAEFKDEYKNGFSIMANCCLCIEALESFKNGQNETPRGENSEIFDSFFKANANLKLFAGNKFYKNIRCGILHQGETTGGWRILRNGTLLDKENKSINSVKFLEQIKLTLEEYAKELTNSEWDSEVWDNCRTKMRYILKNCKK